MYALCGDQIRVNLSVSLPRAFRAPFALTDASLTDIPSCKRVMLFDEQSRSIMAMAPYRALASSVENGRFRPNTASGVVDVPTAEWNQRKNMLQARSGRVTITRKGYSIEGNTQDDSNTLVQLDGKLEDACWSPLLTGFMTTPDTFWVPASLGHLDPPIDSLLVMETEMELLRADFAWLDGRRIVQCFGGLGGVWSAEDKTAELVSGGKFYSPLYGNATPGSILYLAKKKTTDDKEEEEVGEKQPAEKKRKVEGE